MKVIFLDIDGVLNSEAFYKNNPDLDFHMQPFDPFSIACLRRIVTATDAKIVLTSSWRAGWSKDASRNQAEGLILNRVFRNCNLEIYDKTPNLNTGRRPLELIAFMKKCPQPIDAFVIIDDHDFHWKQYHMDHRFVQTDFEDGGLMDKHVEPAIRILNSTYPVKDGLFRLVQRI